MEDNKDYDDSNSFGKLDWKKLAKKENAGLFKNDVDCPVILLTG